MKRSVVYMLGVLTGLFFLSTGCSNHKDPSKEDRQTLFGLAWMAWLNTDDWDGGVTEGVDNLYRTVKKDYIVLGSNDLGMHCLNPEYDTAVILPPYNNLQAQVIKRGNPPQIVTDGVQVHYSVENNTTSTDKGSFGQFWTYASSLFGTTPDANTGLTGKGLSGSMDVKDGVYRAEGIPLTPIRDDGKKTPYQVADITVKDGAGNVLAETKTTIPTSDEINCSNCHGAFQPFQDILVKHDRLHGTDLQNSKPVLCAGCHGSPALGASYASNRNGSTKTLSEAMHASHSTRGATCYSCHPGPTTACNRSTSHTATDGNCTHCHGSMAHVAETIASGSRTPWVNEPACSDCHKSATETTLSTVDSSRSSSIPQVDTGSTLFRNAKGHGNVLCSSCHGAPHAMVPTSKKQDNYQPIYHQGYSMAMGDCRVCHSSSKGAHEENEFDEAHAGSSRESVNACYVCHTQLPSPSDTSKWPHSFQWSDRSGGGGASSYHRD